MKKILFGFIALFILLSMSVAGAEGMISYWKFDEGNGTIAYDSIGNNDGAIHGTTWTTGQVNGALEFDGLSDYVSTPLVPNFSPNQSFTIEAWYKTNTKDVTQFILGVRRAFSSETIILGFHEDLGLGFHLRQNAPLNTEFYTGFSSSDDNWHHITGVFNETTNLMELYLDGQFIESGTFDGDLSGQTRPIYIGALNKDGSLDAYFDGVIDEVKIYNYALSAEEILANYNEVAGGEEPCDCEELEERVEELEERVEELEDEVDTLGNKLDRFITRINKFISCLPPGLSKRENCEKGRANPKEEDPLWESLREKMKKEQGKNKK